MGVGETSRINGVKTVDARRLLAERIAASRYLKDESSNAPMPVSSLPRNSTTPALMQGAVIAYVKSDQGTLVDRSCEGDLLGRHLSHNIGE